MFHKCYRPTVLLHTTNQIYPIFAKPFPLSLSLALESQSLNHSWLAWYCFQEWAPYFAQSTRKSRTRWMCVCFCVDPWRWSTSHNFPVNQREPKPTARMHPLSEENWAFPSSKRSEGFFPPIIFALLFNISSQRWWWWRRLGLGNCNKLGRVCECLPGVVQDIWRFGRDQNPKVFHGFSPLQLGGCFRAEEIFKASLLLFRRGRSIVMIV